MFRLRAWLVAVLLACAPVWAADPAKPPASDGLGRDTPRGSISSFLEACHDNQFVRASEYLDLSRLPKLARTTQGPDLARHLCQFLDRDMNFEVENLSNVADGISHDDLPVDLDRLATVEENGHKVSLYLIRQDHGGIPIWVVSADSVSRIASLPVPGGPPALERYMPEPLIRNTLLGTPLWSWFGLVLLGLALALLSRLISRFAVLLVRPITRRYTPWLGTYRMGTFIDPMRLLLGVVIFRASMEAFAPSALLREFLLGALALLAVIGAASILMRIVDVISDRVISGLDPAQRSLSYSVIPLGVRFLKICIFSAAGLLVLEKWGVQVTTIIAGVGVGGLAVALAAQKTIENLFGGISILTDRPVLVGDVCQFGGQTGTVTDIGLRSTRVRTSERTIVTIPNATFSTMTLENLSRRDRMLFHPTLHLRRDTSAEKIRELMRGIEKLLRERRDVDATDVPVRFVAIGRESFQLEIFSYVLTTDGAEFLRVQSDLLLRLLQLAEDLGVGFALPLLENVPAQGTPQPAEAPVN